MFHPSGIYTLDITSPGLHFYQILKNIGISAEEIPRTTGIESDLSLVFKESLRQIVECIDDPLGHGIQLSFLQNLHTKCPDMRYLKNITRLHDPHRLGVFADAVRNLGIHTYTLIDNGIEISRDHSYYVLQATPYRLVIRKIKEKSDDNTDPRI